jgi:FMN-dependent NADH-azoreductase
MSNILLITSSPRQESYSTQVARTLADGLAAAEPGSTVTVRDLTHEPLPHIDDSFAQARNTPAEQLTEQQRAALELSDKLLAELFAADSIVIAAGMINFGIPSSLKAWIDYIVRPGVTFRYGAQGPEGLVQGKKVYLVVARGGIYSEGPMQAANFQDTYLRTALGFIGLTDVEVIAIEGVGMGPDKASQALSSAMDRAAALTGRAQAA